MIKSKPCTVDGCENPRWSRKSKMCKKHHQGWLVGKEIWDSALKKESAYDKVKKRAKAIKKVSDKRARQNQAYNVARKLFLKTHPKCAVFPHLDSTEIHHSCGRRGDMLLDTRFWFAVSREGHNKIHSEVEWAEKKGFLIKGRNSK